MRALRVSTSIVAAVTAAVLCAGCGTSGPAGVESPPTSAPTQVAEVAAAAAQQVAQEAQVVVPAAPAPAVPAPAAPARAPAAAAPKLVPGTPCSTTARACVDLSARRTWLISDGEVVYGPVPITTGRAGFRTPTGTYRVQFKDIDHKSSLFDDAPMPYSVFFNGGVAFHQGSLRVLSHGCVHLSATAARTYFSSLEPGDVVQVRP